MSDGHRNSSMFLYLCAPVADPEFSPFKPINASLLLSPRPGPPAPRRGKGVAVSLGTPTKGILRLEYPRAQGSRIILACSILRSPKSRECVQVSHSKSNSCCETGTKGRQQEPTRKPCATRCWLLACRQAQPGPGQVVGGLCWLPRGTASSRKPQKPHASAHSTELGS